MRVMVLERHRTSLIMPSDVVRSRGTNMRVMVLNRYRTITPCKYGCEASIVIGI